MEALGPLLIVLSIPLLLRWVPRNRLYGFRVPATLRHDTVWYEVNARTARHALALGGLMVALEFLLAGAVRTSALRVVAVVGLAALTVVNWRDANRLARTLDV